MKKFFAIIMTFVMAFILVGCKKTPELSFEVTSYNLKVGEQATLKPTIVNLEGKDLVSYKVTSDGIIKLEGEKVTALKEGTATITASLKDYENVPSVTLTIKVIKEPVTDIKITGELKVRVGEKISLKAEVIPANATYKEVSFKSADELIATIDNEGNVSGIKEGKVKITVSADGINKEIEIEVLKPLATAIKLTGEKVMTVNTTQKLKVELTPPTAEGVIQFTTSDEKIATVDKDGNVKALKDGTVTITAKVNELESKLEIVVEKIKAESVTLTGQKDLIVGETFKLEVKVLPQEASQKYTLSSTPEGLVEISEDGTVTALKGGVCTIIATTENGKEGKVEFNIKEYSKDLIIVDKTLQEGNEFTENEKEYKVGQNAFLSLAKAIENANEGSTIIVKKGTYDEDITIDKKVLIKGPNFDIDPIYDERVEEAIITGVIKLASDDITINGIALTGKGQITSVDTQLKNLTLSFLNVYDKGAVVGEWKDDARDYSPSAAITIVRGDNVDLTTNIKILSSKFDVRGEAIKLGRVENVQIEGNAFYNFERDAIKFSGGVNGGYVNIVSNEFVNDNLQGYNAIFLASYGDIATKDPIKVTVKENYFYNIGTKDVMYSGVMSSKAYQEKGAIFLIEGNYIDTVTNGFNIRSNATELNHKDFPWEFTARLNEFHGEPIGNYFNCRFTQGDTDKTTPKKAIFDENIFYDNNGGVIKPNLEKLPNIAEIKNTYNNPNEFEKKLAGIEFEFTMVVDGNFAQLEDGTKGMLFGKEIIVGETGFSTISKALAKAKDGDIIFLMPGTYSEDINVSKKVIIFGSLSSQKAIFSGKITLGSDTRIDGIYFDGACEIEIKQAEGIVENVEITRNEIHNPKSSVDAFIAINSEAKNIKFNYNTLTNPKNPRFLRAYQPVDGFEMIGNNLEGSKALYDFIRFDKGFGGRVYIEDNYFGHTLQSGFMVMSHRPGDFTFKDNKFIDQQNVAIDIRSLVDGGETPKATLNIIHNTFDRSGFETDPWGCIRIRFKGYEEANINVNVNYNTFINWGLVDVVEDAGNDKYAKPLVNGNYNYFEGLDLTKVDEQIKEVLGGIAKSYEGLFKSVEELEEAYNKVPQDIELSIEKEILKVDEETLIKAVVLPTQAPQEVTYTLSEEGIISIDETGKIKALKEGVVTITAKAGFAVKTVEITILPWEGIKLNDKKYDHINDAIRDAKENDVIVLHGIELLEDVNLPNKVTLDGGGIKDKMAIISGKITLPSDTTIKNLHITGKSCINIEDLEKVSNVKILNCIIENTSSPNDAFICINTEASNLVFNNNEVINPRNARFIRGYKEVTGFEIMNNNFSDAKAVYDYIRFDKALGGEFKFVNNYVGSTNQSGLMVMAHKAGNFLFEDNKFGDILKVAIDIRELSGTEMNYSLTIRHNEFNRTLTTNPWGCIRVRYGKYTDLTNLKVNVNYNSFIGWKDCIIDNCGTPEFKEQIVNFDNNYVEGVTAQTIEGLNTSYFGNILKSFANTYDTKEALDEAYKALPKA